MDVFFGKTLMRKSSDKWEKVGSKYGAEAEYKNLYPDPQHCMLDPDSVFLYPPCQIVEMLQAFYTDKCLRSYFDKDPSLDLR